MRICLPKVNVAGQAAENVCKLMQACAHHHANTKYQCAKGSAVPQTPGRYDLQGNSELEARDADDFMRLSILQIVTPTKKLHPLPPAKWLRKVKAIFQLNSLAADSA